MSIESNILKQLEEQHNLRTLRTSKCSGKYIAVEGRKYINLSSNDYLGLGSDVSLQQEFLKGVNFGEFLLSNPSSRLMTGNSSDYETLEQAIERLYSGRRALVLSNGYAANTGILPAITTKEDLIIADKLVHASIIDGLKLCSAKWLRYNHNDMNHLETLIKKSIGEYRRIWVVTESVFSMDGDVAPLRAIVELKRRYNINIYLDEAHSFGVFGANGAGYASSLNIDGEVDLIVATLGKALASCGAFVLCNSELRDILINRMRTLIFSTALPPINLQWSSFLIDRLPLFQDRREHLFRLIELTRGLKKEESSTQIVPIMIYENEETLRVASQLRDNGFWVTPIRTPTVPVGKSRIRVSLTSALEMEDVKRFIDNIEQIDI